MSKKEITTQDEAFEMIELAIDNMDLLTRAFDTISEYCEAFGAPSSTSLIEDGGIPEELLN